MPVSSGVKGSVDADARFVLVRSSCFGRYQRLMKSYEGL